MQTDLYIKEVKSKAELKKFIEFPNQLYARNKYYIPALKNNELKILSSETNPAFEFCKAKYWIAVKNGKIAGRVAGIINTRYNEMHDIKYARFGWLDFINDPWVLELLLQTSENWARSEKMDHIHGPLGFSSFDPSGVLIKGFYELPTSFGHYNFRYYSELLEKAGYKKDIDWVEYNVKVPEHVPDRITKGAELIRKRYGLKSISPKSKRDLLRYSDDIFRLINMTYKDIYSFSELSEGQIKDLKKKFASILIPAYVSIIKDRNDKIIGFGIAMPSLSNALQKSGGKLFPFGFLRILHALHNSKIVDTLLIGVDSNYQNKGINGLIFNDIIPVLIKKGITCIESNRELENNNKVNNLWNKYESRQHKCSRCYIKKL